MTHWKLTLAYDGTPYNGWQVQPGLPTVQGFLADALHRITGERVLPQGSGRTDTGVHALGQVASFQLAAPSPLRTFTAHSTAACPPASASSPRNRSRQNSTPDTAPCAKPTSTASFPCALRSFKPDSDLICPPTLAPTSGPVPGRWTSTHLTRSRATWSVPTTSPPSPQPTRTYHSHGRGRATPPPIRTITHSRWHATRSSSSTASPPPASSTTWSATWWGLCAGGCAPPRFRLHPRAPGRPQPVRRWPHRTAAGPLSC